jgi:hypothetical protein
MTVDLACEAPLREDVLFSMGYRWKWRRAAIRSGEAARPEFWGLESVARSVPASLFFSIWEVRFRGGAGADQRLTQVSYDDHIAV